METSSGVSTGGPGSPSSLPARAAEDGRWVGDSLGRRLLSELPLLAAWTRKEYRARYRQSALGIGWSVAQPLATLAAFGFVFGSVLRVSSEGLPYVSFAYAGLVPWSFFSTAVLFGTTSLMNASAVVTKAYFPREVIPLAFVATCSIDLGIASLLLFVIMWFQGIGFSYTLVALIPAYAVLVVLAGALATLFGTLTVFVRDLRYIVPLAIQMLFIASPVMYSSGILPAWARWLDTVNPISVVAGAVRDAALEQTWPRWELLGLHGAAAVVLLLAAVLYVRSVEPRIADVA